jgi:hypothetical protein
VPEGAAAAVRLTADRPVAIAGRSFEVRLEVATSRPLSHLPVTLEFDPGLLAVEAVEPGEFFGGGGEAQILSDASEPGRLVLGASRMGDRPGVGGSGTVAVITFRALADGEASIGFARAAARGPALDAVGPLTLEPARIPLRQRPEGIRPGGRPDPQGEV